MNTTTRFEHTADVERQLQRKALLVVEEAVHWARYRRHVRSDGIRFALAYLWLTTGGDRAPFDEFWQVLDDFTIARQGKLFDLSYRIHHIAGMPLTDEQSSAVWRKVLRQHRAEQTAM